METQQKLKVAIVHDWLTNMGGAEQVVMVLLEMFPDATVFTSLLNRENVDPQILSADIRTSFLQRLPKKLRRHQRLLPFMPLAFEQFNLNGYDLVISSSSSCAKGIITGVNTLHVCYCYTPMRYAWDFYHEYIGTLNGLKKSFAEIFMSYIRIWDRLSADRVDGFIAISNHIKKRIKKHYAQTSQVIYPPVWTSRFRDAKCAKEDFYLVVSRLVPYKRIDLAIHACNELGKNLIVIGSGQEFSNLKRMAGPTVKLLGRQPDQVVNEYIGRAKAFLFPGEEDFGITMVEAISSACPVIAFGRGGATDIVLHNVTGILFEEQTVDSLKNAIKLFEQTSFDVSKLLEHSKKFDKVIFKEKFLNYVLQLGNKNGFKWTLDDKSEILVNR